MTIGLFFIYVADNQVSEINMYIYGGIIWLCHAGLIRPCGQSTPRNQISQCSLNSQAWPSP